MIEFALQRNGARGRRRGLTLLEVILAMSLLVVVSSMTYWFYSSCLETSREGTATAQKYRLVRVVLDRIAREIRQAASLTGVDGVGLRGWPERIWLSTYRAPVRQSSKVRMIREEEPWTEYDLGKVEYKIVRHPEIRHEDGYEFPLGLARVEILVPRPLDPQPAEATKDEAESPSKPESGGAGGGEVGNEEDLVGKDEQGRPNLAPDIRWDELYAPEVRYLRFCFYDGHKWWDSWEIGGENPLPQLVMVTIGFEPHPPFGDQTKLDEVNEEFCECLNKEPVDCEPLASDQYSTVVRVSQADTLFRSRISRETQAFVEDLNGEPTE